MNQSTRSMRDETYTSLSGILGVAFFAKIVIGFLLLICGTIAAFWLLQTIYAIIDTPEEIALLERIARLGKEGLEIDVLGSKIAIPPDMVEYSNIFFGYGILIILLLISAGITKIFLHAGAGLIKSDIKTLLEKLGEGLHKR